MSVNANSLPPLPRPLSLPPASGRARRQLIGDYRLGAAQLDRFNLLLAELGRAEPALEADQLASAARELSRPARGGTPDCIAERLYRADVLARMASDRGWDMAEPVLPLVHTTLDYVTRHEGLIPDWLPQVGRLDDAIVIDTALPRLAPELGEYLSFCRARHAEAWVRGCEPAAVPLRRAQWDAVRRDEGAASLRFHRRQVRESCYAPQPVGRFRIQ